MLGSLGLQSKSSSNKGIGLTGAIVIGAVVVSVGTGIGMLTASESSTQRQINFQHNQAKILDAKLVYDHCENLMKDSLPFAIHWAAWCEGRGEDARSCEETKEAWKQSNLPTEDDLKRNFNQTIKSKFGEYGNMLNNIEKSGELLADNCAVSSPDFENDIQEEEVDVNVSFGLSSSIQDPKVQINDRIQSSENVPLRYRLVYENALDFVGGIDEGDLPTKTDTLSKSNCGNCPGSGKVEQKCKNNYKNKLTGQISGDWSSSDDNLQLNVKVKQMDYEYNDMGCSTGEECGQKNEGSDCDEYCRSDERYGDTEKVNTSKDEECGSSYDEIEELEDGMVLCCQCEDITYRKTRKGKIKEVNWAVVKLEIVDSKSKVLTDRGYKNLKFIRDYNVTFS